jgi:hypothetical protein
LILNHGSKVNQSAYIVSDDGDSHLQISGVRDSYGLFPNYHD